MFRAFSIHVQLPRPVTSNAAADAAALLEGIRSGHVFTSIDAIATPATFEFTAESGGATAVGGDYLESNESAVRFVVQAFAPAGARTILLRDGRAIAEVSGGTLVHQTAARGVYRVEVLAPGAPGTPPVRAFRRPATAQRRRRRSG
jgi:hypothetical protein